MAKKRKTTSVKTAGLRIPKDSEPAMADTDEILDRIKKVADKAAAEETASPHTPEPEPELTEEEADERLERIKRKILNKGAHPTPPNPAIPGGVATKTITLGFLDRIKVCAEGVPNRNFPACLEVTVAGIQPSVRVLAIKDYALHFHDCLVSHMAVSEADIWYATNLCVEIHNAADWLSKNSVFGNKPGGIQLDRNLLRLARELLPQLIGKVKSECPVEPATREIVITEELLEQLVDAAAQSPDTLKDGVDPMGAIKSLVSLVKGRRKALDQ